VTLALAVLLCLGAAPAEEGQDPLAQVELQQQRLFERVAPAVVFITNGKSFGSGFFVSSDGLILTNEHVVAGSESVRVVLHDGRKVTAKVLERGGDQVDVALLKAPLMDSPALPLSGLAEIRVGSWVGSVGHGRGAVWTFNSGMVSNIYPDGEKRPLFQTQIPLNPGSSGGPIFDRHGRTVGLVVAGIENASSLNFGIAMDLAILALPGLAKVAACLVINAPAGVPVFFDNKMVGVGPRVVVSTPSHETHEVFAVIGGTMKRLSIDYPAQREVELK
jgi:S1-C subfamily serine protease